MKVGKTIQSMDIITDNYIKLGYQGSELRKILEKEYQILLKKRKEKLTKQYKLTSAEKNKYFMPSDRDFEILDKCKQLDKLILSRYDKYIIKLILTQLYDDWRKPLIQELDKLLNKYKKKKHK